MIALLMLLLPTIAAGLTLGTETTSNETEGHQLYQHLFLNRGYNRRIEPVKPGYRIGVHISFFLKSINGLDEVSETLQTSAFLRVEWNDKFLKWNTADFNNLSFIYWPQDDVWKPDVVLFNADKSPTVLGHKSLLVENYNDGHVIWFPMELFETSCDVDMTYFPRDIHTCEIIFISWSSLTVGLTSAYTEIDLQYYQSNSLWNILETSVENTERVFENDALIFKLKIQRKPQNAFITLFLPILLLSILDLLVFFHPDGGERSGYAVTIFLAFCVYFTIVDSAMPSNPENTSLFSYYLIIQTSQSAIITVLSVLLHEEREIPGWIVFLCLKLTVPYASCNKKIHGMKDIAEAETAEGKTDDDGNNNINRFLVFLRQRLRILCACCGRKKKENVHGMKDISEVETAEGDTDDDGNTMQADVKEQTRPITRKDVGNKVKMVTIAVFLFSTVCFFIAVWEA